MKKRSTRRLIVVATLVFGLLASGAGVANAGHCGPIPEPGESIFTGANAGWLFCQVATPHAP